MEVPQSPFHYERVEIHQINFRGPVAEQQGVGEDSQDHTGRHFEMTITKSEVLTPTQFAEFCSLSLLSVHSFYTRRLVRILAFR